MWLHFTDWLTPEDTFTKAMRDELLDAFKERVQAVGWIINEDDFNTVKNSDSLSDRVTVTDTGSSTTYSRVPMGRVINRLTESRYVFVDVNGNPVPNDFYATAPEAEKNIFRLAAYDLGMTEAQYNANLGSIANEPFIYFGLAETSYNNRFRPSSHWHWNILKRAIQKLRWANYTASLTTSYRRNISNNVNWDMAKLDFFAEPYNNVNYTGVFILGRNAGSLRIRGQKKDYTVTLPDLPIFTNEYPIVLPSTTSIGGGLGTGDNSDNSPLDDFARATLSLTVDSLVETLTLSPSFIDTKYFINGVAEGNSLLLKLKHKGIDTSSYLDAVRPPSSGDGGLKNSITVGNTMGVWARPNFTHPYS